MKRIRLLVLLSVAVTTACISPMYDTARTTEGFTISGGVPGHYFPDPEMDIFTGGIDLNLSYAPTNWFSFVGRGGLHFFPLLNAGAGVKFSTSWENINLALRAEAHYPHLGLITALIGFGSDTREYVTLGIEKSLDSDFSPLLFTTLHPSKNFHIFIGSGICEIFTEKSFPPVSIGIACTWCFQNKKKRKQETLH